MSSIKTVSQQSSLSPHPLSPPGPSPRSLASDSYPASPSHPSQPPSSAPPHPLEGKEHLSSAPPTQSLDRGYRPPNAPPGPGVGAGGRHVASLGRPQPPHAVPNPGEPSLNGPRQQSIKEYRAGHR